MNERLKEHIRKYHTGDVQVNHAGSCEEAVLIQMKRELE